MKNKNYDPLVAKSNKELERELNLQLSIIYSVTATVLWKEYGWRKTRIYRLFDVSDEVWQECANYGTQKSMLEILEEETGIEIAMPGKKSFHELSYLDSRKWDGKPPTKMQFLYLREQQKFWIPSMLLACICISLHRKEKWGADERLERFVASVETIRNEYGKKPKLYYKLLEDETDFKADEMKVRATKKKDQDGGE